MKQLFGVLILLYTIASYGQTKRQYFDEKYNALPGAQGATYYREIKSNGKGFIVKDVFVMNDQLAMEAICSEVDPIIVYDGLYKTYFKNGQLSQEGKYEDNRKRGLWKTFYENGQQKQETLYEKDKTFYKQHWDDAGNAHLVNGTGSYSEESSLRGKQQIEILNHLLIASYSFNPTRGDTVYQVVQETAMYEGGMPALYAMIGETLRYPANARRQGIEGKVFIEFVIEKDGTVRHVKAIKGPGGGLNEEAERVLRLMNKWTPGKVRGKPVPQMMVLPVAFRLG
jgi:TonB family protein